MVQNPATPENLNISVIKNRIDKVFSDQKELRPHLVRTSAKDRILKLRRLETWIDENKNDIRKALYNDFRKPAADVDLTEIWISKMELKAAIRNLRHWVKPRKVSRTLTMITTRSWIQYEPRGVVLIISPWNYPINLTFGPLVSAIAAGNSVIMKPSEFSPNSSRLMAKAVGELFPENEVALFEGEKEVAIELLKKPFDHIFFTGSTETGKKVMVAAAKNLTSITLELGGKSPAIVDTSANLKDAAEKIAWGKFMNCGQTCLAPDYVIVEASVKNDFTNHLKRSIEKFFGETETALKNSSDYSRLIHNAHFTKLRMMLDSAIANGAKVLFGADLDEKTLYISPTVLSNLNPNSTIMQEEIFGPILPVLTFENLPEALKIINALPKPLALYIFSRNKKTIESVLAGTSAGGTCINDTVINFAHMKLPFGGVNTSGMGSTHGFHGFKAFSHERAILKHHLYSPLKWMFPPYTKGVKKIIDIATKYFQ
ncbi:aldehyde dehydrogenase family protein [Candidatus Neomarinimicrobiota bacterium]